MMNRIRKYLRSILGSGLQNPDAWFKDWATGGKTKSGANVNADTAMTLSTVWQATNVIAGDVALLPLELYRKTGENDREIDNDNLAYRLVTQRPNNRMSWLTFAQTLQSQALLWGNGYAVIARDITGAPKSMYPLRSDRTYPVIDNGQLKYKNTPDRSRNVDKQGNPKEVTHLARNILHIPGLGWDGLGGLSVISLARESFGLGLAAQDHGARYFGNYATPQGVLSVPGGRPSPEVHEQAKRDWRTMQSDDNQHDIAILYNGATFNPITMSNEDSQWLESRSFQRNEIASWFNLPPHKVGDLDRATFSNIFEQNMQYLTTSLMRWLKTWEYELDEKMLTDTQKATKEYTGIGGFEFNTEAFLRADPEKRTNAFREQFMAGKLTINEWRLKDGQNTIGENGDVHFVPMNMTTLERAIEGEPEEPEEGESDVELAEEEVDANEEVENIAKAVMTSIISAETKNVLKLTTAKNFIEEVEKYYGRFKTTLLTNVLALGGCPEHVDQYIANQIQLLVEVSGCATKGTLLGVVEIALTDSDTRVLELVENIMLYREANKDEDDVK